MAKATIKNKVLCTVDALPEDASYEDVMERIYVLQKVERGQRQIEAGEGVPHDEAKRQIKQWRE